MGAFVRGLILTAAVALVAAACSSDDESASQETSTTTTAPASDPAASTTTTADTTTQGAMDGSVEGDLTFTIAGGFGGRSIGEGVKPDVALAPDGTPGITYLLEDISGFIAYADAASDWAPEQVVQGYFYGPIGLAYTPEGVPHIGYHDHQDTEFQQDKGDLTVAVRDGTSWTIDAARGDGTTVGTARSRSAPMASSELPESTPSSSTAPTAWSTTSSSTARGRSPQSARGPSPTSSTYR